MPTSVTAPAWLVSTPPLRLSWLPARVPLFTSVPVSVSVPELVSVAPATSVLAPLTVQFAFASIVIWAKWTNCVPRPPNVPADAPEASSSVLTERGADGIAAIDQAGEHRAGIGHQTIGRAGGE